MNHRSSELKGGARLTLFLVSYLPLFLIMIVSQLYNHGDYLNWGGFNREAASNFFKHFGAISVLSALSIFGIVGLYFFLKNIGRRTLSSGVPVKVLDIENKNSESISYLFTYVIPFVFQDLSSLTDVFSVAILLTVTFLIYSNSSMLLINPTISMRYSLYMIEYQELGSKNIKKGMLLSRNKFLEEDDCIKIKKIGHKLFYATDLGD